MKHDIAETDESGDSAPIARVNDEADEPIIIDSCGARLARHPCLEKVSGTVSDNSARKRFLTPLPGMDAVP
jgi:hypothetical protein